MKKITLAFFLIIGIFSATLFVFKVNSIEVNQNSCISTSDVPYKGKLIFTISQKKIEDDLEKSFSCVSEIKVHKIYPSKLKIELQAQNLAAQIANTNFSVTSDGIVKEGIGQNLPQLFLSSQQQAPAGQKITDEVVLFAIKVAALIRKSDFRASNIRILDTNDIAVYDTQETVVIFSWKKSADDQVDTLQQVLARAKIGPASLQEGDKKIEKIDLRFNKAVITYK